MASLTDTFNPQLPSLEELLASVQGAAGSGSPQGLPGAPEPYAGGGLDVLMALLASGSGPPSGVSGGFTPTGSPGSAGDYGAPDDLLMRQGVTGVPAAVRSLMRGERQTGADISSQVVSDWRSRAEQQALYARYLAGAGNLAAPPGHSMHEVGRAFDIDSSFLGAQPEVRDWLTANGWSFPVAGEPWHAEWGGPQGQIAPPAPPAPAPAPAPLRRRRASPPSLAAVLAHR